MKRLLLTALMVTFCCIANAGTPDTSSPVGYWKTIDDVTGKPKSILRLTESSDHSLVGTVVRIFPPKGEDQRKVCKACTGENHNKPIVGMVVLSGLKNSGEQWDGGNILDPHNGKTYRCNLHTIDQGQKLYVRGYIGLPLLGRTQTWLRVSQP